MLTSKMHALNGLTAVLVSANMAYLVCTIKYLYYTCKTSKLSLMSRAYNSRPNNCTLSVAGTDTVKGALRWPYNL